ncbi:histidinol-phosphate transaminase [Candidatus Poribacteria bacterium]|nr:histidinol-phosphate transaminase [Candidatus Poribacteria bacterium]MYH83218.1 histidinol-phosphate transaminase [Candidatus Poribacteria bacterium]MYK92608.1 histidinol-phosphate transaminase [Candidatus Poribacteria bacterium]
MSSKTRYKNLIRPNIADMAPYTPIVPFDVLSQRLGIPAENIIKLDANENPYGPSPRVYEALADETYYHIYPDPDSSSLRQALSEYIGVEATHIVAGHGADELIDLIIRLFIAPGDAVINCPPTFGMYRFDTELNGGSIIDIERKEDFSLDTEAVVDLASNNRNIKLVFITSPNNPDGGILGDACLQQLLQLPLIVVLDEAYIEFAGGSRANWVLEHENLIVLRTFSKWAGLAGLRVGYGIFPYWILSHLLKIKQPYNVNVAGAAAALASLSDVSRLQENVRQIVAERGRLYAALQAFDFLEPYPSEANFILSRVIRRDAAELKATLAERGILIRYFETPGLRNHVRISVGTPSQTSVLLEVLSTL